MCKDDDAPICEMKFNEAQTGMTATVRLWRPVFDPDKVAWYCLSEIVGLEEGQRKRIYGSDPFQAIILSMTRFRLIFERYAGKFRAPDGDSHYTIFPTFVPWFMDLMFIKTCVQ